MSNYRISNTNGNANYPSVVRIYRDDVLIAEQFINKSNPLGYLRNIKRKSKHIDQLWDQCSSAGMSLRDFERIVLDR